MPAPSSAEAVRSPVFPTSTGLTGRATVLGTVSSVASMAIAPNGCGSTVKGVGVGGGCGAVAVTARFRLSDLAPLRPRQEIPPMDVDKRGFLKGRPKDRKKGGGGRRGSRGGGTKRAASSLSAPKCTEEESLSFDEDGSDDADLDGAEIEWDEDDVKDEDEDEDEDDGAVLPSGASASAAGGGSSSAAPGASTPLSPSSFDDDDDMDGGADGVELDGIPLDNPLDGDPLDDDEDVDVVGSGSVSGSGGGVRCGDDDESLSSSSSSSSSAISSGSRGLGVSSLQPGSLRGRLQGRTVLIVSGPYRGARGVVARSHGRGWVTISSPSVPRTKKVNTRDVRLVNGGGRDRDSSNRNGNRENDYEMGNRKRSCDGDRDCDDEDEDDDETADGDDEGEDEDRDEGDDDKDDDENDIPGADDIPHPYLGKRVKIVTGPFRGLVGRVVATKARGWWTLDCPELPAGKKVGSRQVKAVDDVSEEALQHYAAVTGKCVKRLPTVGGGGHSKRKRLSLGGSVREGSSVEGDSDSDNGGVGVGIGGGGGGCAEFDGGDRDSASEDNSSNLDIGARTRRRLKGGRRNGSGSWPSPRLSFAPPGTLPPNYQRLSLTNGSFVGNGPTGGGGGRRFWVSSGAGDTH